MGSYQRAFGPFMTKLRSVLITHLKLKPHPLPLPPLPFCDVMGQNLK